MDISKISTILSKVSSILYSGRPPPLAIKVLIIVEVTILKQKSNPIEYRYLYLLI